MIMDLRSSLTETKSSQRVSSFPAGMTLIKLIGVANLQWPVIARKFLPLCHRDTRLGCVLTNTIKTKGDVVLLHVFNLTITKEILEHLFHTLGVSDFLLLKTG